MFKTFIEVQKITLQLLIPEIYNLDFTFCSGEQLTTNTKDNIPKNIFLI